MNPRVFREYDIRGVADRDLDPAFTTDLGRAIGTHLVRAGARVITLGRDCRLSSPRLHAALLFGLNETGLQIIDIGVVATPVLYFSVYHLHTDGGVQNCAGCLTDERAGAGSCRLQQQRHSQFCRGVRPCR